MSFGVFCEQVFRFPDFVNVNEVYLLHRGLHLENQKISPTPIILLFKELRLKQSLKAHVVWDLSLGMSRRRSLFIGVNVNL